MTKNLYAGTGISTNDNAYQAGKEAVASAIEKAGKTPEFGFVFCSGGKYGRDDQTIKELVKGAHEAFMEVNPKCKWIGCTTCGELHEGGFSNQSVVAAVLSSEYLKFSNTGINKIHDDPVNFGMKLAKDALANLATDKYLDPFIHFTAMKKKTPEQLIKMIPYTLIVLNTGVSRTLPPVESELLEGIKSVVGARVPIVGGSAADDGLMKKSYVFHDGTLLDDGAVVTAVFSDLKIGFGVAHGYRPVGKVAFVSDVSPDGHVVLKLDNRPAADVVAEWLGLPKEEIVKMIKLPTGAEIVALNAIAQKNPLASSENSSNFTLRVPVGVTPEGGIVFAPRIRKNSALYLMEGDKQSVLNAADVLIKNAKNDFVIKEPAFGLFFDCSLRWFILLEEVGKEAEQLSKNLGSPFIGFYTYGELAAEKGETASLCNQTLAALIISNEIYAGD
ncbi:FIST C-terminal domain-containing protein [Candidatus Woesearchaeota archaeon]|nr:FIST C-terminal domain-containing protein [Candidatus Woesearchaeota archaeon]